MAGNKASAADRDAHWLHGDMQDALEMRRHWQLQCIQAEAELRALRQQVGKEFTQLPTKAPAPNVQEGFENPALPRAGDTGGLLANIGNAAIVEQSLSDSDIEAEALVALSSVLALEQQIVELELWQSHVDQDIEKDSQRATRSELKDEAQEYAEEARAVLQTKRQLMGSSGLMSELSESLRREEVNRRSAQSEVWDEAQRLAMETNAAHSAEQQLQNSHTKVVSLRESFQREEADLKSCREGHERLHSQRQEASICQSEYIDGKIQFKEEAVAARQSAQARQAATGRLQKEVGSARLKSERRRRQMENQLAQCRSELVDAVAKADVAGEQLRKVKTQHGKQLGQLRAKTGALQAEVDEHVRFLEASEDELTQLQQEEDSMASSKARHFEEEQQLAEQAQALRADFGRLEHEAQLKASTYNDAQTQIVNAKARSADCREKESWLSEEAAVETQKREAAELDIGLLREELEEQRSAGSSQIEEVVALRELEATINDLRSRNAGLSQELLQLQEEAKQGKKEHEKTVADMQEVLRRSTRLKASHYELLESLPSNAKGKEALIGVVDQGMVRVSKKIEFLLSYLENPTTTQKTPRSEGFRATVQRSEMLLHKRLEADAERDMGAALLEEKRKVVVEQQRALEEARRRATELQQARQARRQMEEECARCSWVLELERHRAAGEADGLIEQVRLLEQAGEEGADAVTTEFQDLLQKLELERDALQTQVDDLRNKVEGAGTSVSWNDGEEDKDETDPRQAQILQQQYLEEEAEAEALRTEEESLQEAYVKLRAAFIVAKQQLPEGQPFVCLRPLTPCPTLVDRRIRGCASRASSGRVPRGGASDAGSVASNCHGSRSSRSSTAPRTRERGEPQAVILTSPQSSPALCHAPAPRSSAASRGCDGSPTAAAEVVCTTDMNEAQRAVSMRTTSAASSCGLQGAAPPPLLGSAHSVSTQSLSTSGSTPTLPANAPNGVPVSARNSPARYQLPRENSSPHLMERVELASPRRKIQSRTVYTWPAQFITQMHLPTETVDNRSMVTLP